MIEAAHRRTVLALCFAVGVIEGFDIQIIGVAAPLVVAALGLTPTDLSWIFFASNLGILIGAMAGGRLADRRGRRPILIASAAIFGVFTFAAAFAGGFVSLLIFRVLAGIGLGGALPNLVATAADASPPGQRGFATGLIFCGVPLGGAAVALLAQALPSMLDWRTLFVIGGTLPMIVAAMQWRWLPETRPAGMPAEDVGTLRQVLFDEGRALPTVLLWLAVAPTLMALYLVLYWLPTLVVDKGLPMATAAQASAAFNLAGVFGAVAIGAIADRLERTRVLAAVAALFVIVALFLAPVSSRPAILALSALGGFLLLGLNYAVYGLSAFVYPEAFRGTGSGATVGVGRIGSIIGPVIPGFLLASGSGPDAVLRLLAPAAAMAGIAVAVLGWVRTRRADGG